MTLIHRRTILAASAAAGLAAPAIVRAQGDWPKGTIRFVVPFPPGGSTDPVARIILERAPTVLAGQPVVIQTRLADGDDLGMLRQFAQRGAEIFGSLDRIGGMPANDGPHTRPAFSNLNRPATAVQVNPHRDEPRHPRRLRAGDNSLKVTSELGIIQVRMSVVEGRKAHGSGAG